MDRGAVTVFSSLQSLSKHSNNPEDTRFEYLDALRGIAILGVVLVHSAILSQQEDNILMFAFTGQRGVQLFYMVSAFTLFLMLDSRRTERLRWSNFYIRRFCRIAPMFYLAILGNLSFFGRAVVDHPNTQLSRLDILLGFLFLHGFSWNAINSVAIGGWSIAVEASFYALVPLLFLRLKNIKHALLLFVASGLVLREISFRLAVLPPNFANHEYFRFLWFPVEFPVFCLGVVTYLTWKQYVEPTVLRAEKADRAREMSMLLLLVSAVLYLSNVPLDNWELYYSSAVFLPLILALSLHPWPLLVNRFTVFMGKISYSVYLCHFFVMNIVTQILTRVDRAPSRFTSQYLHGRPLGFVVTFLLTLGFSVPICMFTWRFVEQPGIRLGKAWIRWRENRASLFDLQGRPFPGPAGEDGELT